MAANADKTDTSLIFQFLCIRIHPAIHYLVQVRLVITVMQEQDIYVIRIQLFIFPIKTNSPIIAI